MTLICKVNQYVNKQYILSNKTYLHRIVKSRGVSKHFYRLYYHMSTSILTFKCTDFNMKEEIKYYNILLFKRNKCKIKQTLIGKYNSSRVVGLS